MRIAVVGSGFAGSILARVLSRLGHESVLVERGTHPRFALGESSTPLAALSLERLAARYDLPDLDHLAAYGRWQEHHPELRCGLKRGFTFYGHRRGRPYANDESNAHRLLVAASPHDGIADVHWLRADTDRFLVEEAITAGVEYMDRTEVTDVSQTRGGLRLHAVRDAAPLTIRADVVIDATGPVAAVARALGARRRRISGLRTGLVYGHFEGVASLQDVSPDASWPPGPYPDERAAVHHLLPDAWLYALPFDHGVVSAGFLVPHGPRWRALRARRPAEAFETLLEDAPSLHAQFANARPLQPVSTIQRVQYHLDRAAGRRWAALPHTVAFWSPLFSTGIAWSLIAVERLASAFETRAPRLSTRLARYEALLQSEARHLRDLITPAYATLDDFDQFAAYSLLYFAAASFAESRQRLTDEPAGGWAWTGFLGADDVAIRRALRVARRRISGRSLDLNGVEDLIRSRNVAGLADPSRGRLYPVDMAPLIAGADRLGLDAATVRTRVQRLRGWAAVDPAGDAPAS